MYEEMISKWRKKSKYINFTKHLVNILIDLNTKTKHLYSTSNILNKVLNTPNFRSSSRKNEAFPIWSFIFKYLLWKISHRHKQTSKCYKHIPYLSDRTIHFRKLFALKYQEQISVFGFQNFKKYHFSISYNILLKTLTAIQFFIQILKCTQSFINLCNN